MEIRIPDIGDFADVPVIEVHVSPGSVVAAEDPLVTLESDKATMDVPSPVAGTIGEVRIAVGDQVSEGDVVATLEGGEQAGAPAKERVHESAHPRPRPSRPATGRRPGSTSASRSRCPTSATSRTCP